MSQIQQGSLNLYHGDLNVSIKKEDVSSDEDILNNEHYNNINLFIKKEVDFSDDILKNENYKNGLILSQNNCEYIVKNEDEFYEQEEGYRNSQIFQRNESNCGTKPITQEKDRVQEKDTKDEESELKSSNEDTMCHSGNIQFCSCDGLTTGRLFNCTECSYSSDNKQNLMRHIKALHDTSVEIFRCTKCCFQTKTNYNLIKHQLRHDNNKFSISFEGSLGLCETQLGSNLVKARHGINTGSIKTEPKDKIMFKCYYCDFETLEKRYLTKHVNRRHITDGPTFKCTYCFYETRMKQDLVRHTKAHHDANNKTFKCVYCAFITKCNETLQWHVKELHPTNRHTFFKCGKCNFKSEKRFELTMHMKNHNGDGQLFKCGQCSYRSKFKGNLLLHAKIHEKITDGSQCEESNYETNVEKHLVEHIRENHKKNHQVYKRLECMNKTKPRYRLLRHEDIKRDGIVGKLVFMPQKFAAKNLVMK